MSEHIEPTAEPEWIEWRGGECPIKSDKTVISVMYKSGESCFQGPAKDWNWDWLLDGKGGDIIAYRITEDHEPKITREQITAQIEALVAKSHAARKARSIMMIGN